MEKYEGKINRIHLNQATFHSVDIKPTVINFFYGKNGVGKSTVGRALKKQSDIYWKDNSDKSTHEILVFNKDFIEENFSSYDSLQGVFTIGQENIEVQNLIDDLKEEQDEFRAHYSEDKELLNTKKEMLSKLEKDFRKSAFDNTKDFRESFPSSMSGAKKTEGFIGKLNQSKVGIEHDFKSLQSLYDVAFDKTSRVYPTFTPVEFTLETSPLLQKSIVSSSNSTFANFVKKYQATDWVRQGHQKFHQTDGKCPYCQQELPDDFEEIVTAIFDNQYQDDIDELKRFTQNYLAECNSVLKTLRSNTNDVFPDLELNYYSALLSTLENMVGKNSIALDKKTNEPTLSIELEDISEVIDSINKVIDGFNQQIQKNNDIVNSRATKQRECTKQVWELIRFKLQADIDKYEQNRKILTEEINRLESEIKEIVAHGKKLGQDIDELSKQNINTLKAVQNINHLLHRTGFQGFSIREKTSTSNVYEVVRDNGEVAKNLSEGEQNFIAFLYFYQLVQGSNSSTGTMKEKIVVIDDPVSSMDSSVLFIVSSLVREMIEICRNNVKLEPDKNITPETYIQQIFVLTHNTYFHNSVTNNMEKYLEYVSFYLVNKVENQSSIKLCLAENKDISDNIIVRNVNPVKTGYHALWSELKELRDNTSSSTISLVHVMHQILDYYFVQMCHSTEDEIRKRILEHKEDFQDTEPGLTADYHIIQTLLAYLYGNRGMLSDSSFIDEDIDKEALINAFHEIFTIMGQDQHFVMMLE